MELVTKIDQFGKPAWIAAMILGFWFFWPVGLAILAFTLGSGRIGHRGLGACGRWYNTAQPANGPGSGNGNGTSWTPWGKWGASAAPAYQPSGNNAFDDYRAETLRRLEEEQKEFQEYLERLRKARDKQEFDQFMAERRNRSGGGPAVPAESQ